MFTTFLTNTLKCIGLTYLGVLILIMFFANHLMFPKVEASYKQVPPFFKLTLSPGKQISVIYIRPKKPIATLILSHGNGEDLGRIAGFLNELFLHHIAVLAYDYPGYGHSDGMPTEQGTYMAIDAAYAWLRNHEKIPPGKIFLYGYSIGSGPTVELATKHPDIGGMIIDSGFTSAYRVVTSYPLFPFDHYKNLAKIRSIKVPTLFIHGTKDRVVPFWHGQALYQASPSQHKSFLWIDGGNHMNRINVAGVAYWKKLSSFLNQYARPTKQPNQNPQKKTAHLESIP